MRIFFLRTISIRNVRISKSSINKTYHIPSLSRIVDDIEAQKDETLGIPSSNPLLVPQGVTFPETSPFHVKAQKKIDCERFLFPVNFLVSVWGSEKKVPARKRQDSCVEMLNVQGNLFRQKAIKSKQKDKMKN